MGIINTSPESFYKKSVKIEPNDISLFAKKLENDGADVIDVGGLSTAPYLDTLICPELEIQRLKRAIQAIRNGCSLPISVDTPRSSVAKEVIKLGIDAINDVCGLKYDENMAPLISKHGIPVIIGAYSRKINKTTSGKSQFTNRLLMESIEIAKHAGIEKDNLIVDPCIGFFRSEGKNPFFTRMTKTPWFLRDINILSNIKTLTKLDFPVCISISRKSLIGKLFNLEKDERLIPSLILETIAAMSGVNLIRTHSVKETRLALNTLASLR